MCGKVLKRLGGSGGDIGSFVSFLIDVIGGHGRGAGTGFTGGFCVCGGGGGGSHRNFSIVDLESWAGARIGASTILTDLSL